jgi:hypothetical protein
MLRQTALARDQGYRERALQILPHICGSCGREFEGKRLRELTVHHKDHNWKNNPPDGSNWELLCLFCHDHEHEKQKMAGYAGGPGPEDEGFAPSPFSPFADLDKLVVPVAADAATPNEAAAAPPADDRGAVADRATPAAPA